MLRVIVLLCSIFLMVVGFPQFVSASVSQTAYVTIQGEINEGKTALVRRAITDAKQHNMQAIVIEIDTFGGLVDAAIKIRDMVIDAPVHTICYVKNRAWSAGALIALSHQHIIVAPGASIGAAEPIPATEKNIAALKAEFSSTASRLGRNSKIAEAMVDKMMGYPPYAQAGQILAITDQQAVELGYAETIVQDTPDLLKKYGLDGSEVIYYHERWADKLVGWLAEPMVKSFLLSMIFLAVFIEIKTAGTGMAALLGMACAFLFFGSHWISGISGWIEVMLFILGIIFIVIELLVPGVGLWGVGGISCILASFYWSLGANQEAVFILVGSLVFALLFFAVIVRYFPSSRLWEKIMLKEKQRREDGFISSQDYRNFLGKRGIALTLLRPSGMALVEGFHLNVVSTGEFVNQGVSIKVVNIEGNRIVVEKIEGEK